MNNTPNNQNPMPRPTRAVRRPGETPQGAAPQNGITQTGAPQTGMPQAARPAVRRPQTFGTPPVQSPQRPQTPPQRPAAPVRQVPVQKPAQTPPPVQQTPQTPPAPAPRPTAQQTPIRQAPVRPAAPTPVRQPIIDNTETRQMAITTGSTAKKPAKAAPLAPPKKKKKQMSEGAATLLSIVKAITYIVFVIVLAGFLSYFVIQVANDMFAFVKSDEQVTVTIPEYATINEVSEVLAEAEIIAYPEVFKLYAKLNKDNGKFKAGDYEINAMMNYDELLMAFKERFVRQRVRLTIPEGYTVDEIIDLFVENGVGLVEREEDVWVTATREDYIAAVNNLELYAEYFDFVRALIGNTSSDRTYQLEGYLFPDTYEFYTDSKPSQIVYKLLNRFDNVFKEEFYTRSQELGYTVDEIVILASMVEKEARLYNEFEQVSSVFHNRLRNKANYPFLESDATIMYAIHHDTGTRKEDMKAEDTDYVSPYNTYTNRGLPPGPIANPSYQAITCALYPEETDYYYFVSRKNGETVFSKTFPEHQAAVAAAARE